MPNVPVFYATTHGQTMRIAERIAERLRDEGHASLALDVTSAAASEYRWRQVRGVVLAASLHVGAHQHAAETFARERVAWLNELPSWFVSVSLSAASRNQNERLAAQRIADTFVSRLGWLRPRVSCVAGRLAYTRYSFLTRWFMRRIARKEGAPTDISRDYELTDWASVDTMARQFGRDVWQSAGVVDAGHKAAHIGESFVMAVPSK